jgi:hypothetical protein
LWTNASVVQAITHQEETDEKKVPMESTGGSVGGGRTVGGSSMCEGHTYSYPKAHGNPHRHTYQDGGHAYPKAS